MPDRRDKRSPKKQVALAIDARLASRAAADGLDLARLLEQKIADCLRARPRRRPTDADREAIEFLNSIIEEHGLSVRKLRP